MNRIAVLTLFTLAAFAAGFFVLRLWPVEEPGVAASSGRNAPAASPNTAPLKIAEAVPVASSFTRRLEAKKRAAELSVEEARAIIEGLRPPLAEEQHPWLTAVLRRWAEGDPAAALAWLQQWAKEHTPWGDWPGLVTAELAKKDLAAAVIALRGFGRIFHNQSDLFAAAAERDPAAAMAYAEKNRQFVHDTAKAFRVWLKADPAAACAWLNRDRLSGRYPAVEFLMEVMAQAPDRLSAMLALLPEDSNAMKKIREIFAAQELARDPAATLAKFPTLPDAQRKNMIEPLARHLAARGTPEEITTLLKQCSAEARAAFLSRLGAGLEYSDAERILALIRLPDLSETEKAALLRRNPYLKPEQAEEVMALLKHEKSGSDDAVQRFWTSNLQNRPAETLPVLQRMAAANKLDRDLLLTITGSLMRNGTAGAEAMIAALPETLRAGPQAVLAVQAALTGASTDLTAFSSLPDAAAREAAVRTVFNERQSDFDSATRAAFIRQLPEAQQIEVLNVMALTSSDATTFLPIAADAARRDPGGAEVSNAVSALTARLPDFSTASQWLDTLPASPAQDAGRLTAFLNYARTDTIAASAWLAAWPANAPLRDDMTGALVTRVMETDPGRAWQWAATIQDERRRQQAQEKALTRWREINPEAAQKAAGP